MAPPKMGAEWEEWEESHKPPKAPASIEEYRAYKDERGKKTQALLSDPAFSFLDKAVAVENIEIDLPEVAGRRFPLRIYRPDAAAGATQQQALPIMLYFHGGYWCAGTSDSEDLGCRAIIARGNPIIIASFGYRRVPDVPWHAVLGDAEWAMKWVSANAASLGADTARGFLIGGAEAGAHLAATCAVRARNRYPNVRLTGQCLIVPTTLAYPDERLPAAWAERLGSHRENAEAPVLSQATYEQFVAWLGVPDDEKRKGENFPAWGPLQGLPPAYIPVDECDPIRDQGFLYAELLQQAGVLTRTDYYRGLPNMFVQFPELPSTLNAGGHLAAGIAWLLQERK